MKSRLLRKMALVVALVVANANIGAADFANPPRTDRPGIWFHLIGGNVAKPGITADLEAIAKAGLSSVTLFHEQVGGEIPWPGVREPIPCLSEHWHDMIGFFGSECKRLGLDLKMQNCPGWSTSGGPWIDVTNAMRIIVHSRTDVSGGGPVGELPLPHEATDKKDRDYRDIAVLAFPTPALDDGRELRPVAVETNDWTFVYDFGREVDIRSFVVTQPSRIWERYSVEPGVRFRLTALDCGKEAAYVKVPRTCWMDDSTFTVACEPLRSRKWRFDVEHDHRIVQLKVKFLSAARLENWEGASGLGMRGVVRRPYPNQPADEWIAEGSVRELSGRPDETLPPGKWTVLRIGHVNALRVNHPAPKCGTGWECSKLDRSGIEAHFSGFIGEILKGPLAGGKLEGVLIDSWECMRQTWGNCLEEEFAKASEFRLREWMPALFGWVVGNPAKTRAFLHDWSAVRARLVEENYYRRFAELAHEAGLKAHYETAFGDVIAGDLMRFWKWSDDPMCEYWQPHTADGWVGGFELKPIRPCVSAAHIYGKKRVVAEALTSFDLSFDENFRELKSVMDLHFCRGITYPILQAFTHRPEVGGKGPGSSFGALIGTPFLREQTWWPYVKDLCDYSARCTMMLERGLPVVDVLRYLGDDFDHRPVEPEALPPAEFAFKTDYLNGDVLDERLDVRNGRLTLPDGMGYSVLWIPGGTYLTDAHRAKIARLEEKGATVVRGTLEQAVAGLEPQVVLEGAARGNFEWYHRRDGAQDIWFLAAGTNGFAGTVSFRVSDGARYVRGLTLASSESVFLVKGKDGWSELDPTTGASRVVPPYGGNPRWLTKWDVEFPSRKLTALPLLAWKDLPGSAEDRAFSGTAVYRTQFEATGAGSLTLDLGRVRDYAEVSVNGRTVRRLWCEPYACDIGQFVKKGVNELRVDITSSWYNRLAADAAKPESERVTWTLFGPKAGSALHESGLLGPVRLIAPSSVESFSPALFWWWNSKLDVGELCAQVDEFHAHGSRTLCIHPFPRGFRPGRFPCDMEPEYLSDAFLGIYAKVTEHAAAKGMTCWLYDEGGWPSGGACGQVLASDPARFSQRWMGVDDEGRPKLELARYRPDVESPYPSILEPGVLDRFLSLTHERYGHFVGHHFGKAIPWLFTDEPTAPHGWFSLGWCSDFAEEFRHRKGYDIMPFVPALVKSVRTGPVPEDLKKVRIDYFDTMSQLQLERFIRPYRDWCRANGLVYGGHFDGDDDPKCNLTHGHYNLLKALRSMDLPGVDCIWRQLHPDSAYSPLPRYASSAAHQTGAKRVLSESFAIYGESMTPEIMKRTVDFELVRGINQFVFAFACQSTKRNFMSIGDPHFGPMDPKWPFIRPFMDYVRDASARLASGFNPVNVAVYYDVKSIWAGGLDPREESAAAVAAQMKVAQELDVRQVDFDFVDDEIIESGRLPFAAIVLPTCKWLSAQARAQLDLFRAQGGLVVSAEEIDRVPRTCRATGTGARDLRVTKRILSDGAVDYFLVNDGNRTISPEVSFAEGPKLVRVLDAYASEFIRIFPGGRVETPAARPSVVTARELRDGWTVRKVWSVKPGKDDFEYGDVTEPAQPCRLGDWRSFFGTNFSGRAVYRLAFIAAVGEAELDLGKVGVCASARLNGQELAPRFAPPFRWHVPLQPGTNVLEVTVGNTLANALIPELDRIGRDFPPKSSYSQREMAFYGKDDLSSGLIGPVVLNILSTGPDVTCRGTETAALQGRIDALAAQGGGTLVVPKGIHPTGALFFKPGVNLHLDEGAVLLGSDEAADYPLCETRIEGETCRYYPAMINADRCDGFTISGCGTVDGHGFATWEEFWRRLKEAEKKTGKSDTFKNKDLMRPRVLYVSNSKNVDISGVTFKNAKFWTTHFYQCEDVVVHDCVILADVTKDSKGRVLKGPSTDAVDIDKCRNFTVRGCRISVNDDGVVVKGGKGAWANDYAKHPENGPSSNVIVEDCDFLAPTHSCLTLGSECPEAYGIIMRNCRMEGAGDMLYLKMRTDTPQRYSDILVEGMTGRCETFLHAGAWAQYADFGGRTPAELKSCATNVVIRNCRVTCRVERNVRENPSVFELNGLKLEGNEILQGK